MKSPSLLITIVQSDLYWENPEANLKMFEEKINAHKEKMEIVILPEMFSTGFSMNPERFAEAMDGPAVAWMRSMAISKGIIIGGSLMIREGGNFYNRFVWMLPQGEFGYYDKRHLFGAGREDQHYTPGNKRLIASVKGWKINLLICYDLRFPVWSRQSVPLDPVKQQAVTTPGEPEYDLIIYVANWPEPRIYAWKTLLQARAIENQSYVVGVNRIGVDGNNTNHTGESMIADPLGQVLHSSGQQDEVYTASLSAERIDELRKKLPFLKDADSFMVGDGAQHQL
jgi:omega-amidase